MNMDDLRETARLAHLNLDDAALARAFPAFEQMLGFFAAMQAADQEDAFIPLPGAEGSAAWFHGSAQTVNSAHFRPDAPPSAASPGLNAQDLDWDPLDSAGGRDGQFIMVPNVL
jgi:aspartyl-tRNA(Asn)/glutamyl-tRNA(Gln) amidotransferase subunit C